MSLRGHHEDAGSIEASSFVLSSLARWLQDATSGDTDTPPSRDDDNSQMLWLVSVAATSIVCYGYCTFMIIRHYWCRRDQLAHGSMVVHEGMIFDLNPTQRRAVLEVIFSETCQAVEKKDKKKKKKKKSKKRGGDDTNAEEEEEEEHDVEEAKIPESITMETKDGSFDEEATVVNEDASIAKSVTKTGASSRPMSPDVVLSETNPDLRKAAGIPLPMSPGGPLALPLSPVPNDSAGGISTAETPDVANVRRMVTPPNLSPTSSDVSDGDSDLHFPSLSSSDLSIPVFDEREECEDKDGEYKEEQEEYMEEEAVAMLPLPPTIAANLTAQNSVLSSHFEFIDDDSTDGNVCAICLSGYEEGETVIASKYCPHLFHRDCILEWLEKHDMCPCCRTDMVTSTDMNKAATSIVGKTRMCRAVAALKPSHLSPPPSPTPGRAPHSGQSLSVVSPRIRALSNATSPRDRAMASGGASPRVRRTNAGLNR